MLRFVLVVYPNVFESSQIGMCHQFHAPVKGVMQAFVTQLQEQRIYLLHLVILLVGHKKVAGESFM